MSRIPSQCPLSWFPRLLVAAGAKLTKQLAQTLWAADSRGPLALQYQRNSFCCASSQSAAVTHRYSGLLATTWQLGGARRSRIVRMANRASAPVSHQKLPVGSPHQKPV